MFKKLVLLILLAIIAIFIVSCEDTSTIQNSISVSNEEVEYFFNEDISEQEKELFIIGSSVIEDFFDVTCDSSKYLKTDILDMDDYAIVSIPADFIYFVVKISYSDMEVYAINNELYTFTQFLFEEIDDYQIDKVSEYGMYKYEKVSVNQKYAERIIKEFVLGTPLERAKLIFNDVTFEYKYNTEEIEYYVFKYNYVNEDYEFETIYFKVDAYMKKVVQMLK